MKTIGLMLVLFGFAAFWLLGVQCLTWDQFQQTMANWLHVPIGDKAVGVKPTAPECP